MCLSKPKVPQMVTPPPAPKVEEQKTDDDVKARSSARDRMLNAMNSRSSMMGGRSPDGKKTMLGQ